MIVIVNCAMSKANLKGIGSQVGSNQAVKAFTYSRTSVAET